MSNTTTALIIVASLNLMIFLGQAAIDDINGTYTTNGQVRIFNGSNSIICSFDSQNCQGSNYQIATSDNEGKLPSIDAAVSPSTGNIFTDTFSSLKTWISTAGSVGSKFFTTMLFGPAGILADAGVNPIIVFGVGAFWASMVLFMIISWISGRSD